MFCASPLISALEIARVSPQPRLKNWTSRSCLSAAARDRNVPRLRRRPVRGSALREYNR
jgi:hypothetical protein